MERDGPKTVQELFDGIHRDTAECWNRESVYHEWWVFNAREESQWAMQEPGRFLFVFCRACGVNGTIETHDEPEWTEAQGALNKPYELRRPTSRRVRSLAFRPEKWEVLTEGRVVLGAGELF